MEFSAARTACLSFVEKDQCPLGVQKFIEEEGQILLNSKDQKHSFCVSCPTKESSEWFLWSDLPASHSIVQDVMDRVNMTTVRDISQILEAITAILNRTVPRACSSDGQEEDGGDTDDEEDDEEDDDDYYYTVEDFDARDDGSVKKVDSSERKEQESLAASFSTTAGSPSAVSRLVKDLKAMTTESQKFGIVGSPQGNNLFVWNVKLVNIPLETKLGKDLQDYHSKYKQEAAIELNVQFPPNYPYAPPFIRVIRPRFKFLTGHVTVGGSICMEMLTNSGWCPTNDIESILVQVRTEILSDPKASLDPHRPHVPYGEDEAKAAFRRMVEKYGWS